MTFQRKAPGLGEGRAHQRKSSASYHTTGPADVHALLSRLDKVKETRSDSWTACCPGHDDKTPSLNIRLTDDGKILLKCWSGCSAAHIVTAVGLELHDLFPRRDRDTWSKPVSPSQRWIPRDVLASVAREALVVVLAAEAVQGGQSLAPADLERLASAAGRLRSAARGVGYEC